MEREIKFRAFNPNTNNFEFLQIVHNHSIMTSLPIPSRGMWNDLKPFQQFTGIIVKGKELYEGDIVKFDSEIYTIKYNCPSFNMENKEGNIIMPIITLIAHCIEIIGNVYENKNLLQ